MSSIYSLGLAASRPGLLCRGVPTAVRSSARSLLLEPPFTHSSHRYQSAGRSTEGRVRSDTRQSSSPLTSLLRTSPLPLNPSKTTSDWARTTTTRIPTRHISFYKNDTREFTKVIRNYVEIPATYTDKGGLPFARRELEQNEVMGIFGNGISTDRANKLLRILHGRRVAGTLNDPTLAPNLAGYKPQQIDAALAYLRKTLPVDELINAGLYAEDELNRLEEEAALAAEEAEQVPLESMSMEDWQRKLAREKPADDVYGVSVQETIRARNKAISEKEERARAEAQRLEEEEWARLNPAGTALAELDPHKARLMNPEQQQRWAESRAKLKEYTEGAMSDIKEAPKMSHWQRLGPSVLLAAAFVVVGVLLAAVYSPPPVHYRLWPDLPPAAATVAGIIAINLAIFVAWKLPPCWKFLNKHFVLVVAMPRPIVSLTAGFSHQAFSHLATNMALLWLVGTHLHDDLGRGAFLATYLGTMCLGYVGSTAIRVLMGDLAHCTIGASGAVYGIIATYFTIHKFDEFHIWLLPESWTVPGMAFLALTCLSVVLPAVGVVALRPAAGKAMIDNTTHVAGWLAGLFYGLYYSRTKGVGKVDGAPVHAKIEITPNPQDLKDTETVIREKGSR